MKFQHKRFWLTSIFVIGLMIAQSSVAGFLEMPDTTEVPEMKRDSMLKDLDIPSVRERDPDPNTGPRLNVTEFRVQGVVEYPELGITRESLNKLVEGIRFDMMDEGEMLDSGYSLEEVSEISDLIAEIEHDTEGEHVGPLELQRLVFLIRDQRQRRGVTVGMIENVADTITRYYRERGFILAKAYIPEQRVRDGVVTLTLLLGNLGEVNVINNKRFKTKAIEKIFNKDFGEPVTAKRIEEKLFFVNDMPGLRAQAYFEAGSQVGDTRLNVNVVEEKLFNANVRIDNHGSESTGEFRLYTDGYWNNPTGFGDQLHIGILGTFDPANSTYASIHYGIPIFGPRAKFTFGGSTNAFESSLEGLTLTGESQVLDATLNYILKRSRERNFSVELRIANIETDITDAYREPLEPDDENDQGATTRDSAVDDNDSKVTNIDLAFNFDMVDEKFRGLHQGGFRLTTVDQSLGRREFQEENPLIFALNYSLLKFVKVPFTDSQSRLVVNIAGQYADTALPSTSQLSLAGPNRMRGFAINSYNADSGFYVGADWIFNSPSFLDFEVGGEKLNAMIQPYLFLNTAYGETEKVGYPVGKVKDEAAQDTEVVMADIGFGLKLIYKNNFRSSLTVAQAVHYRMNNGRAGSPYDDLDDLESTNHVYFEVQYSF